MLMDEEELKKYGELYPKIEPAYMFDPEKSERIIYTKEDVKRIVDAKNEAMKDEI